MKYPILLLALIPSLLGVTASAQPRASEKVRPQWLHKLPEPSNSTFRYEVVSAQGGSLDAAREKCLAELISESGLKNGIIAVSDYQTNERVIQNWANGRLTEHVDYETNTTTTVKGSETKLYVEHIAEYWTQDSSGDYYLTRLYAKSELDQAPLFDNVELTTRYGAQGLWRSAIIPGWGQFHKGTNLKGGLILGGSALLIAGIVYTSNLRSDYTAKITKTHDANLKKAYATKRDNFTTGRNACIGALSALYIYNLIDAIVTPGAQRVVVKHRNNQGQVYAFTPVVLDNATPGLAVAITF